jgi:hypothetical protein
MVQNRRKFRKKTGASCLLAHRDVSVNTLFVACNVKSGTVKKELYPEGEFFIYFDKKTRHL